MIQPIVANTIQYMKKVKHKEYNSVFVRRIRHFNLQLIIGRKHFKEVNVRRVVNSCDNLNAQTTMLNIVNARFYNKKYYFRKR